MYQRADMLPVSFLSLSLGSTRGDIQWLLAYDLGTTSYNHRHDDQARREKPGNFQLA